MNASTSRSLKPTELLVLMLHQDLGAMTLHKLEKSMGPRGVRSPAAEPHAYLIEQALLIEATDQGGNVIPRQFIISSKGEKLIDRNVASAHRQIADMLVEARKKGMPQEEIERLLYIQSQLPEIPAAQAKAVARDDDDDEPDHDEDAPPARSNKPVAVPGRDMKQNKNTGAIKSVTLARGKKTGVKPKPRKAVSAAV